MMVSPSAASAGHDQGGAGADVVSAAPARRQAGHAAHDGVVAVGADVGAHPHQLVDVAEAPGEQVLGHDAHAVGHGQHGGDERLVVGGDARVRQRGHVDRAEAVGRLAARSPPPVSVDRHAHLVELRDEHDLHVLGPGVVDGDLAAGHGRPRRGRWRPRPGRPRRGGRCRARSPAGSTPCTMTIGEPTPSICAPMPIRKRHRSTISGSRAALSSTVVPLAGRRP